MRGGWQCWGRIASCLWVFETGGGLEGVWCLKCTQFGALGYREGSGGDATRIIDMFGTNYPPSSIV